VFGVVVFVIPLVSAPDVVIVWVYHTACTDQVELCDMVTYKNSQSIMTMLQIESYVGIAGIIGLLGGYIRMYTKLNQKPKKSDYMYAVVFEHQRLYDLVSLDTPEVMICQKIILEIKLEIEMGVWRLGLRLRWRLEYRNSTPIMKKNKKRIYIYATILIY
jgi:hypothetical protein